MLDGVPVNGCHVAVVGYVWPVVRHDLGRGCVELAVPLELGAKHFLHSKSQTAVQ